MSPTQPPDHVLRPARVEDLPAILRYERAYLRAVEPDSTAGWLEAIDRNLALWIECLPTTVVLELSGAEDPDPAGFAMWLVEGEEATLVSIHVATHHRRAGLGRVLLAAFEERAAAAGAALLALGVHRENPARELYERAGWVEVGADGDYLLYERQVDAETGH